MKSKPELARDMQAHNALRSARPRCPRGHLYDAANTYIRRGGARLCRACQSGTDRVWDWEREFWPNVAKGDGCWVWTGNISAGYGRLGGGARVHRLAWELAHGPIPEGRAVCHHCDNPPCVKTEPDERYPDGHLFLGTVSDNARDMWSKGRGRLSQTANAIRWARDGERERLAEANRTRFAAMSDAERAAFRQRVSEGRRRPA